MTLCNKPFIPVMFQSFDYIFYPFAGFPSVYDQVQMKQSPASGLLLALEHLFASLSRASFSSPSSYLPLPA